MKVYIFFHHNQALIVRETSIQNSHGKENSIVPPQFHVCWFPGHSRFLPKVVEIKLRNSLTSRPFNFCCLSIVGARGSFERKIERMNWWTRVEHAPEALEMCTVDGGVVAHARLDNHWARITRSSLLFSPRVIGFSSSRRLQSDPIRSRLEPELIAMGKCNSAGKA